MSVAPISSNPFEEPIIVDENAPALSEHFLEKLDYRVVLAAKRAAIVTLTLLPTIGSLLLLVRTGDFNFFMSGYISFLTFGVAGGIWQARTHVVWHKGYRDEICRKMANHEMTISELLSKHSWQEIRVWGLYLSDEQHPLVTKATLVDHLLKGNFFCFDTIYQDEVHQFKQDFWVPQSTLVQQFAENNIQLNAEQLKQYEQKSFSLVNQQSDFQLLREFEAYDTLHLLDKMDPSRKATLREKAKLYAKIWEQYKKTWYVWQQGPIELEDVCNIGNSQMFLPPTSIFKTAASMKKRALVNDWFIKQMEALYSAN